MCIVLQKGMSEMHQQNIASDGTEPDMHGKGFLWIRIHEKEGANT